MQKCPRFEHSNFFKVKVPSPDTQLSEEHVRSSEIAGPSNRSNPEGHPAQGTGPGSPTTSFLTATTLIYAIGAGITAAAGHFFIVPTGFSFHTGHFLPASAVPLFFFCFCVAGAPAMWQSFDWG